MAKAEMNLIIHTERADVSYYMLVDEGEFETELNIKESDLKLSQAIDLYENKYGDGQNCEAFICVDYSYK